MFKHNQYYEMLGSTLWNMLFDSHRKQTESRRHLKFNSISTDWQVEEINMLKEELLNYYANYQHE